MSSLGLDIFRRLLEQVHEVESVAERADREGDADAAPILRRSAFVLAVAGIDTYFHEQTTRLLLLGAGRSVATCPRVPGSSGRRSDLSGPASESFIRLGLSYKTLVSPKAIDGGVVTELDSIRRS